MKAEAFEVVAVAMAVVIGVLLVRADRWMLSVGCGRPGRGRVQRRRDFVFYQ